MSNRRIIDIMDTRAIVESGSDYVKFGNGLLIQWGITDNGVETTDFAKYVTFSKPYTNNNYSCSACDFRVENNSSNRHSYTSIYFMIFDLYNQYDILNLNRRLFMARLLRKNQKIFAENATNNGVFGSLQTGNPELSNDIEKIQSLPAYSQGWNAATMTSETLPSLEETQALNFINTYQLGYILQEGIPEYNASTNYYKGCLVKYVNGDNFQILTSKTDNNKGNGVTNQTYWRVDFDTANPPQLKSNLKTNLNSPDDTTYPSTQAVKNYVDEYRANYATKEELDNYVTLNTTQTIPSRKTFANTITSKTPFSAAQEKDIAMNNYSVTDSAGKTLIKDYIQKQPDGDVSRYLRIQNNESSDNDAYGSLQLTITKNNAYAMAYQGTGTLSLPNTDSVSDRNIPTVGWVNNPAKSLNVVHRTGNETIKGTKTFENPIIILKNPNVDLTVTPTTNIYTQLYMTDKNNIGIGSVENIQLPSGGTCINFNVQNKANTKWMTQPLQMGIDANGNEYCGFPSPINPAENSNIGATTKWVNSRIISLMNSIGTGYVTYFANNCIRFSVGLQICWGWVDNAGGQTTRTFPLPFSVAPFYCEGGAYSFSGKDFYVIGGSTTGIIILAKGKDGWWLAIGNWK